MERKIAIAKTTSLLWCTIFIASGCSPVYYGLSNLPTPDQELSYVEGVEITNSTKDNVVSAFPKKKLIGQDELLGIVLVFRNNTEIPFDIGPLDITADFQNLPLPLISEEQIVKRLNNQKQWAKFGHGLSIVLGGATPTTSPHVYNAGGVIVVDQKQDIAKVIARENNTNRQHRQMDNTMSRYDELIEETHQEYLKLNTLYPGMECGGVVYFSPLKSKISKANALATLNMRIIVGNEVHRFSFSMAKIS